MNDRRFSRASRDVHAQERKNSVAERKAKTLSFVGGALVFSVVALVLLKNDPDLRARLAERAEGCLKAGKEALRRTSLLVSKGERGDSKTVKFNNYFRRKNASSVDEYDGAWCRAEEQSVAYLENFPIP
jgi:hypothetical protein